MIVWAGLSLTEVLGDLRPEYLYTSGEFVSLCTCTYKKHELEVSTQHALFESRIRGRMNCIGRYHFNGERNMQNVEVNSLCLVVLRWG